MMALPVGLYLYVFLALYRNAYLIMSKQNQKHISNTFTIKMNFHFSIKGYFSDFVVVVIHIFLCRPMDGQIVF